MTLKRECSTVQLERPAEGIFSTAMEELDGDDVRVSSRGRFAERDIVQVVLSPDP